MPDRYITACCATFRWLERVSRPGRTGAAAAIVFNTQWFDRHSRWSGAAVPGHVVPPRIQRAPPVNWLSIEASGLAGEPSRTLSFVLGNTFAEATVRA